MSSTRTTDATTPSDLAALLGAAHDARETVARSTPGERAGWLRALADRVDEEADALIALAHEETHIPTERLRAEAVRTSFQLRFFGDVLAEGRFLGAVVDHADADWPMGPRPDIRRVNIPVGPVLVYEASNFPFAFGVLGGDTASALAAGCPVLLKTHEAHPRLAAAFGALATGALRSAGAPDGVFALVHGQEAGVSALRDSRVRAASFTGSVPGGRALFDIAASRPDPIPFYGELGSVNPVFALPGAVRERGAALAAEYVASFTASAGQLCTKPGLLFLPEGHGLDGALRDALTGAGGQRMLTGRMAEGYAAGADARTRADGVSVLAAADGGGQGLPPVLLLQVSSRDFVRRQELLQGECFGPLSLVVTYRDEEELLRLAGSLEPSLTSTVQAEPGDDATAARLLTVAQRHAGRLLYNAWPTGVTVSWAQQHGGPYPSSTAEATTSVGAAGIERFLRPVAWQSVPDRLLPDPLKEGNPWGVPRRTG
ncbi:aldehyde dehydrogenase (NADP(+)) [Streptomyces sp. NPDC050560]|uniref:aldehyde dehydrogenase (NADP(+)) n=1 Tax=Streptomyces sp. NPDC050560 TaxID=3365630 RepID=UPI0037AC1A45